MKIVGVIPARLGSTRLQAKVLRSIAGRPMIEHVYRQAKNAGKLEDLVVACDDPEIKMCVEAIGGKAVLTRKDHPNGTSRVAEVAAQFPADVFINIQGDEPLIHPDNINLLAEAFLKDKSIQVATLAVPSADRIGYDSPNVVKVVCDGKDDALYFSRSGIPYYRDAPETMAYLKHLGLYGYRKSFLMEFMSWPAGSLETAEKLEQLRILERGFRIRVVKTAYDSVSVDTAEDLAQVEKIMAGQKDRRRS